LNGAASSVTVFSGANGVALYTTTGPVAAGAFGYTLTRLTDFDGDGIRDFAAGAPYTAIAGSPTVGQLHLCSGATGAIFMTVNGLAAMDFFGAHIAEIGDLNGDNVPELLVSAGYASPGGIPGAGLARVISGANGAILRTHNGTAPGIACGNGVAGTGDVDADLVPDYAIASPANTAAGGPAGPVIVYSGATGAVIRTIGPTPIPPGLSTNDTFGRALTNAGDLDGDGVADLLLAANPYLAIGPSREIHAYSGATGALISRQMPTAGFTPNIAFPHSAGFDLTGDGALDWVVGQYPTGATASGALLVSFAGIPAGSSSVGGGCNVAGGPAPVLQTGGGGLVAAVGAPAFELLLSLANPGQAGALAVGASNTSWNGQALPLDLTPFGLPGCFLHNSVDTLFGFVATAGGLYGFPAPLPALPSLAGTTAHVQGFLVGAGGAVTAATNGLTIVVQ
jgi:FG-GAP repeat